MSALSNVRVVSMALNVPGPVAVMYLRAQGARISKVEPSSGDPLEGFCRPWYAALHEDVTVERVDLKSDEGAARMRGLLGDADLFVSSQRPAALARLGLDHTTLLANEATAHLRCLNIVGELQRPEVAGHDLTYLARAGLLGSEVPRTLIADVLGAERAFSTALLLLQRPTGSHAEVGLFDSLAPLVAALRHGLTGPGNLLGGALPAYGIYQTRAGRIAVAALEPHFRARLYETLSLTPGAELTDAFLQRTAKEWEDWASEHDLPLSACQERPED